MALSLNIAIFGCAGAPSEDPGTALVRLQDPLQGVNRRVQAAEEAVSAIDSGVLPSAEVWGALRTLGWSASTPAPLRQRAVELLVTDGLDVASDDVRAFAELRLPTERDRVIVALLARAAAANGWTECTTALVRRLAVDDAPGDPNRRIEAAALVALHPDRSLESTVFGVFLDPSTPAADDAERWRASVRGAVWELLGRLDRDASVRAQLLSAEIDADVPRDARPTLATLRRGVRDLGVVPDTAGELAWLERLAAPDAANSAWWSSVRTVLDDVPPSRRLGIGLRHLEPIRWTARHRPARLGQSRTQLLEDLRARLEPREHHTRTAEVRAASRARNPERLSDWADSLRWADLIVMLAADDAFADPVVLEQVSRFVELDRGDEGTEYGGIVEALDTVAAGSPGLIGLDPSGGGYRAVLFPPRSRDRGNDDIFVASVDMIRQSDRALAHFHQQVQRRNNDRFAGPSGGDIAYAKRSGRTCLVFTSVGGDEINVDFYQPNGVVIDLGTFAWPGPEQRAEADAG
ncbi:MAG: hypothetical protein AAF297_02755 [Planctomycetota bacterium]